MNIKLLTEHYLELLSLKGGCTGSSESTLVRMPHCWKSHVVAHLNSDVNRKYEPKTSGNVGVKSKKDSKDQETIQSITTPGPGYRAHGKVTKIH